jgi:hypothetical protein
LERIGVKIKDEKLCLEEPSSFSYVCFFNQMTKIDIRRSTKGLCKYLSFPSVSLYGMNKQVPADSKFSKPNLYLMLSAFTSSMKEDLYQEYQEEKRMFEYWKANRCFLRKVESRVSHAP